jgi:hypothetical protein
MESLSLPWETTEDYIRSGHRSPDDFQPDSMRTITISQKEGIKAVIGKPKGKNSTEVQSYLFPKNKGWTLEKAKAWFEKHKSESLPGHTLLFDLKFLTEKADPEARIFPWSMPAKYYAKPGRLLIYGTALVAGETRKGDKFSCAELTRAARGLVGGPIEVFEHTWDVGESRWLPFPDNIILDGEEVDGRLEYIAGVSEPKVQELIRNETIAKVSVNTICRHVPAEDPGQCDGMILNGFCLLHKDSVPASPGTSVQIWNCLKVNPPDRLKSAGSPSLSESEEGKTMTENKKWERKTVEGRVVFLETMSKLREQSLSKEEIEAKLTELSKQREALYKELEDIGKQIEQASEAEREKQRSRQGEISTNLDLLWAEIQAYQQALETLIGGQQSGGKTAQVSGHGPVAGVPEPSIEDRVKTLEQSLQGFMASVDSRFNTVTTKLDTLIQLQPAIATSSTPAAAAPITAAVTGGQDEAQKAAKARAEKHGISVKKDGHLTKPDEFKDIPDDQFADPVNYRYPVDKEHADAALKYFNQPDNRQAGGYSHEEALKIMTRIVQGCLAAGVEVAYQPEDPVYKDLPEDLKSKLKGYEKPGKKTEKAPPPTKSQGITKPIGELPPEQPGMISVAKINEVLEDQRLFTPQLREKAIRDLVKEV